MGVIHKLLMLLFFCLFLSLVPPKIIPFSFQDEDLYEGMRAQITCAVRQGDLPMTIKWLKDDQPILPNRGITTRLFDGYTGSLSIDSVTSSHNGNYTCVASNAAATVTFTAQLRVNGKECLLVSMDF